jgi:nitrite reductase (NADH) small subunit
MVRSVHAGSVGDLSPGKGRCVELGAGRELAIFKVEGEVYAIDNHCPHRGGPLAEGDVSGCVVYCPLHAWSFDLRTGISPGNARASVQTFPVRITPEGDVIVEVEEAPEAEPSVDDLSALP